MARQKSSRRTSPSSWSTLKTTRRPPQHHLGSALQLLLPKLAKNFVGVAATRSLIVIAGGGGSRKSRSWSNRVACCATFAFCCEGGRRRNRRLRGGQFLRRRLPGRGPEMVSRGRVIDKVCIIEGPSPEVFDVEVFLDTYLKSNCWTHCRSAKPAEAKRSATL